MNIAVIDLGTNTFNLLIAEIIDSSFKTLHITKEFVKLGEGGINEKKIQKMPFQRGVDTLMDYKLIAQQYNCQYIIAIATSAIRNAHNGNEFIQTVKNLTQIDITVIDGNQEAEYIYKGAIAAVELTNENALIMDVGGGSTEFIICNPSGLLWKKSVEVGVTRLFEKFHHEDPISLDNILAIQDHLHLLLKEVMEAGEKYNVRTLIGSSGAFTSLAAMILCKKNKIELLQKQKQYQFEMADYFSIHQILIQSTLNQRLKIDGLIQERASMIVVGSILVNFVLNQLKISNFKLSRYSLKEGVAYTFAEKK